MSSFTRQTTGSLMWEVLAPVARWPLHSPPRLGAIVAITLLGFAACSRGSNQPAAAPSPSASTTVTVTATPTATQPSTTPFSASASATSTLPPTSAPVAVPPVVRPGADEPREVATAFATAWARRGTAAQQWRTDLAPYSTPEYLRRLATVDPARIPATRLTGPAVVKSADATSATVEIPTDGGTVAVRLTHQPAPWRVTDIAPVQVAIVETVPPMTAAAVPSTAGRR